MQPLIFKQTPITLKNGEFAEMLHIQGGPVVVLNRFSIASYNSVNAINDPLGNGRLGYAEFSNNVELKPQEESFVSHIQSGLVQLHQGMALLITPFHATLFTNNDDALEGKQPIAQVPLNAINLE